MSNLPKLTRMKFGVIDEMYMNTIVDAAESFNSLRPAINSVIAKSNKQLPTPFLAIISSVPEEIETIQFTRFDSSSSETVPVAWKYYWKKVQVDAVDATTSALTLGTSVPILVTEHISKSVDTEDGEWLGQISGYAYNLAEAGNVGTYESNGIVFGVDIKSEVYPQGFYPLGMNQGDYLMLQKMTTRDARVVYFFDRQGTHDGTCT